MTAPGCIIAAPASGSGKTLLTLGLLRAFQNQGVRVSSFKIGPDYIDPAFHRLASGRPCFNLDPWAMSSGHLSQNYRNTAEKADLVIGEGVMGLFEGAQDGTGSSADLAEMLNLPIILVVDGKGQSASMGALLHGFNSFRKNLPISGVIFNRVSSPLHASLLAEAAAKVGIPTLGALPVMAALSTPSRHLGLVQAEENPEIEGFISKAAEIVAQHIDLTALKECLRLPDLASTPYSSTPPGQHIAIARDIAFNFSYPHLLTAWRRAGAQLSFFSPLADEAPDRLADFIYLPGGYPELYAGKLAGNTQFLNAVRASAQNGTAVFGECGGYMTLGQGLTDKTGERHQMLGLLPVETSFQTPKRHLGYRRATMQTSTPLGKVNTAFTGHEFHYASEISNGSDQPLFALTNAKGEDLGKVGAVNGRVFGSFIHLIDKGSIS